MRPAPYRLTRRHFLRQTGGFGLAMAAGLAPDPLAPPPIPSLPPAAERKLILVVFGGGVRASETIDDPERRFIPRLGADLMPQGRLFTRIQVERRVVHPNSVGSMVTGHWEWDHLDWSAPLEHPSLFEICRRERGRTDRAAWAFVYASILARISESSAPNYGAAFAANVVEPPTIPRATGEAIDLLLRRAAATGQTALEHEAARQAALLARRDSRIARAGWRSDPARAFLESEYAAWRADADRTTSHDAFLARCALRCMERFAPAILVVAFGEIDCAHYGSWSRYTDAIQRTDDLTAQLWRHACRLPAYRGRTLCLVAPDHGRELERPGGPGFVHHSDFYTNEGADEGCRRSWLLALGPSIAPGPPIHLSAPLTSIAATALEYLGLHPSPGAAPSLWPHLASSGSSRPLGTA